MLVRLAGLGLERLIASTFLLASKSSTRRGAMTFFFAS